ncbi:hypothetical protein [Coleofasciculus sp.]|uniref:hypothetical protein n=1 Tax=Coleofasciculus sp. TaxID=3100458 RepID=UPI003A282D46
MLYLDSHAIASPLSPECDSEASRAYSRSPSPSRFALIPDQKSDRLKHTSILSQGGFC